MARSTCRKTPDSPIWRRQLRPYRPPLGESPSGAPCHRSREVPSGRPAIPSHPPFPVCNFFRLLFPSIHCTYPRPTAGPLTPSATIRPELLPRIAGKQTVRAYRPGGKLVTPFPCNKWYRQNRAYRPKSTTYGHPHGLPGIRRLGRTPAGLRSHGQQMVRHASRRPPAAGTHLAGIRPALCRHDSASAPAHSSVSSAKITSASRRLRASSTIASWRWRRSARK